MFFFLLFFMMFSGLSFVSGRDAYIDCDGVFEYSVNQSQELDMMTLVGQSGSYRDLCIKPLDDDEFKYRRAIQYREYFENHNESLVWYQKLQDSKTLLASDVRMIAYHKGQLGDFLGAYNFLYGYENSQNDFYQRLSYRLDMVLFAGMLKKPNQVSKDFSLVLDYFEQLYGDRKGSEHIMRSSLYMALGNAYYLVGDQKKMMEAYRTAYTAYHGIWVHLYEVAPLVLSSFSYDDFEKVIDASSPWLVRNYTEGGNTSPEGNADYLRTFFAKKDGDIHTAIDVISFHAYAYPDYEHVEGFVRARLLANSSIVKKDLRGLKRACKMINVDSDRRERILCGIQYMVLSGNVDQAVKYYDILVDRIVGNQTIVDIPYGPYLLGSKDIYVKTQQCRLLMHQTNEYKNVMLAKTRLISFSIVPKDDFLHHYSSFEGRIADYNYVATEIDDYQTQMLIYEKFCQ